MRENSFFWVPMLMSEPTGPGLHGGLHVAHARPGKSLGCVCVCGGETRCVCACASLRPYPHLRGNIV